MVPCLLHPLHPGGYKTYSPTFARKLRRHGHLEYAIAPVGAYALHRYVTGAGVYSIVPPPPWDLDSVYVSFYKEMNANANYPPGTLEVQIVVDGEVVQEASSSARDGYVNITWSPE